MGLIRNVLATPPYPEGLVSFKFSGLPMFTKFIVKTFPPVPNVSLVVMMAAVAAVTSETLANTASPRDVMMGCFMVILGR
jgi:hypothetical protein